MKKVYLFDLFDTVLADVKLDFLPGLRVLWENHFADKCTFGEIAEYSAETLKYLREVQSRNDEVCFATDEIELYCKKFGVEPFSIDTEEEWSVLERIGEEKLLPETKELLDKLKACNVPMYILSNSIFRAGALKKGLEKYGVLGYFTEVWSSADFKRRKPATEFFEMAVENILKTNPGVSRDDIVFIGNSYELDATGGAGAGLDTIWLNRAGDPNVDNLPVRIIRSFEELIKEL